MRADRNIGKNGMKIQTEEFLLCKESWTFDFSAYLRGGDSEGHRVGGEGNVGVGGLQGGLTGRLHTHSVLVHVDSEGGELTSAEVGARRVSNIGRAVAASDLEGDSGLLVASRDTDSIGRGSVNRRSRSGSLVGLGAGGEGLGGSGSHVGHGYR